MAISLIPYSNQQRVFYRKYYSPLTRHEVKIFYREKWGDKSFKSLRSNKICKKKLQIRELTGGENLEMGWLISFPPLALIAESSNLFSTNTINCGIGDFVTSSLKIWFS